MCSDLYNAIRQSFQPGHTRAKLAALTGPVLITDRGKPSHVLLNIDEYQRLTQQRRNIAHGLAMLDAADVDFDPPKAAIGVPSVVFG